MRAIQPRSVDAKVDQAWRLRTLLVCALVAGALLVVAAANLDWSEGPAMALGQLAGMAAPVGIVVVVVWAAAALSARNR